MPVLVLFTDEIFHVCDVQDVKIAGKRCSAKYSDKKKYAARVLAVSNCGSFLEKLKLNLEGLNDDVEDTWKSAEAEYSFQTASKEILSDAANGIVFVERSILPHEYMGQDITSFLPKNALFGQENFFGNAHNFIRLDRKTVEPVSRESPKKNDANSATENDIPQPRCSNGDQLEADKHSRNFNHNIRLEPMEVDPAPAGETSMNIKGDSAAPSSSNDQVETAKHESKCLKIQEPSATDYQEINSPSTVGHWPEKQISPEHQIENLENMPILFVDDGKLVEGSNSLTMPEDVIITMSDTNIQLLNEVLESIENPEGLNTTFTPISNAVSQTAALSTANKEKMDLDGAKNAFRAPLPVIGDNDDMNSKKNTKIIDQKALKIISNQRVEFSVSKNFKDYDDYSIIAHGGPGLGEKKFCEMKFDKNSIGEPQLHSTINEPQPVSMIEKESQPGTSKFVPKRLFSDCKALQQLSSTDMSSVSPLNDSSIQGDDDDEYVLSSEASSDADSEGNVSDTDVTPAELSNLLDITIRDAPHASAPDDRGLTVDCSSSTTKKHFCFYCKKFQAKLSRHLASVHANEDDVKKFAALPPKSTERMQIIATIRKNGDHLYNSDRAYNKGELIVCRRPNRRMHKTGEDFSVCGKCKGQYAKSVIRHHWRKCAKHSGKNERIVLVKGKKIAARVHEKASLDVRKYIYPYLQEDEVVRSFRYDELLNLFANKQCEKYGTHQHLHAMVRGKLRLLGRFFNVMKNDDQIKTFADIYQPRFYDATIAAVRVVAQFVPDERIFLHPAVASNLGTLLKHVGDVLVSEYIKKENPELQRKAEDYLKLLTEDFGTSINRVVAETQTQANRRKEVVLPTTSDIKRLHDFVIAERDRYFSQLSKQFSYDVWVNLAKTTLISVEIFNRRRPGETERLYLQDYLSYKGIDKMTDPETYNALNDEGKKFADQYVRFEIRGKLGRGVPVLLDIQTRDCIDLLIKNRKKAGVPEKNSYLFGLPSKDKDRPRYLRACDLLREYSSLCGAEAPESLRGTKLRKHIATKATNLNLSDGQVEDLANFMGHDPKIHKGIYRQPTMRTDIVGMVKILKTVQKPNETGEFHENIEGNLAELSTGEAAGGESGYPLDSSNNSSTQPTPRRWTNAQTSAVLSAFEQHLRDGKLPSGREMELLINKTPCMRGRTVPQLRTWLHTQKKKMYD